MRPARGRSAPRRRTCRAINLQNRNWYLARFFHTYYSRAARSTLHDIDVFPDAASGNRAFDPSCTYNVFFEVHHKNANQLSPLIDVGECMS